MHKKYQKNIYTFDEMKGSSTVINIHYKTSRSSGSSTGIWGHDFKKEPEHFAAIVISDVHDESSGTLAVTAPAKL